MANTCYLLGIIYYALKLILLAIELGKDFFAWLKKRKKKRNVL